MAGELAIAASVVVIGPTASQPSASTGVGRPSGAEASAVLKPTVFADRGIPSGGAEVGPTERRGSRGRDPHATSSRSRCSTRTATPEPGRRP